MLLCDKELNLKFVVVKDAPEISKNFDIADIHYFVRDKKNYLVAILNADGNPGAIKITFRNVEAFRSMDEREYSSIFDALPRGWFYKAISGGWLDEDSSRFVTKENLEEYLLYGDDLCLNVLSRGGYGIGKIS